MQDVVDQDAKARHARGQMAYHAGVSAEDAVVRHYGGRGARCIATRWRGTGGEIDVILRQGADVIFVEVKKAKSFAAAALRISARQRARLFDTAAEFLAAEPRGQLTPTRFDVALVNAAGEIDILENALFDG